MGNSLEGCYLCAKRNDENSIVILLAGLDNAGKTRTVGLLTGSGAGSEAPTVGFQPTQLNYRSRPVHLHDVGGSGQFRAAWKHYYIDAHGLIFVVDSADRERLGECAEVLEEVLSHPHISGKPVLILANKQDLKDAMDDLDIVEKLNVEHIVNRYRCPARVESYSGTVLKGKTHKHHIDPGLKRGYEWLLNYVIHKYTEINLRVKNDLIRATNKARLQNAVSSTVDISETGFENPNYKIDIIQEDSEGEENIIIVQQASDDVVKVNGDVNLSPLFGNKNDNETSGRKPIELEVRTQMTKLSPISKRKMFIAPSVEKKKSPQTANEIFTQQLKTFKSQESLVEAAGPSKHKFTEVSLGDSSNSEEVLPSIRVDPNRRFLPPIKGLSAKDSPSPKIVQDNHKLNGAVVLENRPKSASESVKIQLENASTSDLRKKFAIKGLHRNKTAPEENTNLFVYEPNDIKNLENVPEMKANAVM